MTKAKARREVWERLCLDAVRYVEGETSGDDEGRGDQWSNQDEVHDLLADAGNDIADIIRARFLREKKGRAS